MLAGEGDLGYSLLQFFLFPIGIVGFVAWPAYLFGAAREGNDREAFVDIPFVPLMAGAVWLAVSGVIAVQMWLSLRRRGKAEAGEYVAG